MSPMTTMHIRAAEPGDAALLCELITALAEYEKLTSMLDLSPAKLRTQLFGPKPAAEALIAEIADDNGQRHPAGFALYFQNFSTFLCRPGLYLEDLFVLPAWRRQGIGRALLSHLANIAVKRGYGRFEWSVLDWNQSAIDVYTAAGAELLPQWRICRVSGPALQALATRPAPALAPTPASHVAG